MGKSMRILEIGCGKKKRFKDSIGLDKIIEGNNIIKWDLEDLPLPFKDNFFDVIIAEHVIEHISKDGFWQFMEELHRILKRNGKIKIVTPFFIHPNAFEIDHKIFITPKSYRYFEDGYKENYYSKARFEIRKMSFFLKFIRRLMDLIIPRNMYVELVKVNEKDV